MNADEQQLTDAIRLYVLLAQEGPTKMQEAWEAWCEVVAGVSWVVGVDRTPAEHFAGLGERLTPIIWMASTDLTMAAGKAGMDLEKRSRWYKR